MSETSFAAGARQSHHLGMVNFLFDSSQTPHIAPSQIWEDFDLSSSTMQAKSKQIRDLMGMSPMDPDWSIPSMVDKNPLIWMLEVNGLIIDVRQAHRRDPGGSIPQRVHPLHPWRVISCHRKQAGTLNVSKNRYLAENGHDIRQMTSPACIAPSTWSLAA